MNTLERKNTNDYLPSLYVFLPPVSPISRSRAFASPERLARSLLSGRVSVQHYVVRDREGFPLSARGVRPLSTWTVKMTPSLLEVGGQVGR